MGKELKEWRCYECGQEVFSSEKPNDIKWTDGHVCHFGEYEEPWFTELDPMRHFQKVEVGKAIKNWPDV